MQFKVVLWAANWWFCTNFSFRGRLPRVDVPVADGLRRFVRVQQP